MSAEIQDILIFTVVVAHSLMDTLGILRKCSRKAIKILQLSELLDDFYNIRRYSYRFQLLYTNKGPCVFRGQNKLTTKIRSPQYEPRIHSKGSTDSEHTGQ